MNNKSNKINLKKIISLFLMFAVFIGTCSPNQAQLNAATSSPTTKVHFIDVGQGDSILIESQGHYALVDAGENNQGEKVVKYLKSKKVKKLDFVIGTHPHSDHIGGMDDVIKSFDIGKVILSPVAHTTKTFEDVLDTISDSGLKLTRPVAGANYKLGNATIKIIAPNKDYNDLNNNSIGIKVTNVKNSFVMYGDCEETAEKDICKNGININADVLKLGHHGSKTSTSDMILKAVNPKHAVVSCGKNNQYDHPDKEVMNKLKKKNIKVYRTDLQGTIIATSDGKNIKWSCKPTNNYNGGNTSFTTPNSSTAPSLPNRTPTPTKRPGVTVPVHVTNTGKKYHSSGCSYLRKSDISISLSKAKSGGYTPCSRCNPPK